MLEATIDRARVTWENFNERERRLLTALLSTLAVALFALFVYLAQRGNAEVAEEAEALREALTLVKSQRERLERIAEDRRIAQERYKQTAPPLGSLLEAEASKQDIKVREVNEEPEKIIGGFKRRGARVSLPGVSLRAVVQLISQLQSSDKPVAVEYIQVEHFTAGQDNYNVTIGLVAYDKQSAKKKPEDAEAAADEEDKEAAE